MKKFKNKIIIAVLSLILALGIVPAVTGAACNGYTDNGGNQMRTVTIAQRSGVTISVTAAGETVGHGSQWADGTQLTITWTTRVGEDNIVLHINGSFVSATGTHVHIVSGTTLIATAVSAPNQPLIIGVQQPEAVFNPFFSGTAVDGQITSQTQVGMLSADRHGNLAFGGDYPTVAEDISIRTIGNYTYYQFVLRDDIVFSDGTPLTIRDVLFNFYMVLDPAYTGMSTMNSVDIVGLRSFRLQNPGDVDAGAWNEAMIGWRALADVRRVAVVNQINTNNPSPSVQVIEDMNLLISEFERDLTSFWGSSRGGVEGARRQLIPANYDWEVFMEMIGLLDFEMDGLSRARDENGYFIFNQTQRASLFGALENHFINGNQANIEDEHIINHALRAFAPSALDRPRYLADDTTPNPLRFFGAGDINPSRIGSHVLTGWPAGASFLNELTVRAMSEDFAEREAAGGRLVPNISGIRPMTSASFEPSPESNNATNIFGADREMLQIRIHGVDPRAIWSFSGSIAPMHWYSRTAEINLANNADLTDPDQQHFGVEFGQAAFMTYVQRRNRTPMGAGPFRMATAPGYGGGYETGFWRNNIAYFQRNENFMMGVPYINYLRFVTVNQENIMNMLETGTVHFAEPSATDTNINVVNNLSHLSSELVWTNGYGYVGISAYHIPELAIRRAIMAAIDVRYVDDYFPGDLSMPLHRGSSFESWVHRNYNEAGTFLGHWAAGRESFYFERGTAPANLTREQAIVQVINGHLTGVAPAWHPDPHLFIPGGVPGIARGAASGRHPLGPWIAPSRGVLTFTFNVAGNSPEHPAFMMLDRAADILNANGWDITVAPNNAVLRELTAGRGLEVWAAAWGSAIDPCLFQLWHQHSTAPSVRNWGYTAILAGTDGIRNIPAPNRAEELRLVRAISTQIDLSRSVLTPQARTPHLRNALNLIMELAVELPTYNRRDLYVFNHNIINPNTLQQSADLTSNWGPLSRIWEVQLI